MDLTFYPLHDDERSSEKFELGPFESVQVTYCQVRTNGDGNPVASYDHDAHLWVTYDGRMWSDFVISERN